MKKTQTIRHDSQLISVVGLAEKWAISRNSVVRVLERAGIKPIYIGGSRRYAKADVDRFLRQLEKES